MPGYRTVAVAGAYQSSLALTGIIFCSISDPSCATCSVLLIPHPEEGNVYFWGYGYRGDGSGMTTGNAHPSLVQSFYGKGATRIFAGDGHYFALLGMSDVI